jgi:hypothetical protein
MLKTLCPECSPESDIPGSCDTCGVRTVVLWDTDEWGLVCESCGLFSVLICDDCGREL